MLNKYETIYILKPTLEADAIKANVEKFNGLIESEGGKVSETQEWGMKKLAYPIDYKTEGYYVLLTFESETAFVKELDRVAGITENVLRRFITVRNA